MYIQREDPVDYDTEFYDIPHKSQSLFALRQCPTKQRFKSVYSIYTLQFHMIRGVIIRKKSYVLLV